MDDEESDRDSLDFPPADPRTTRAARVNQEVLDRLQTALKHNPEINLRLLIPEDYDERKWGKRYSTAKRTPSKQQPNGKLQGRGFYAGLVTGLLSIIPKNYRDRRRGKHHSGAANTTPVIEGLPKRRPEVEAPKSEPPGPADICANLIATGHTATIVHPLSDAATAFLAGFLEPNDPSQDPSGCLLPLLKRVILKSEKLWEFPSRGVVLKCNDELVVKIVRSYNDSTEYTSMQYLAEHAPDLPVPKPHGFVKLNNNDMIFMTYFPSTTLEKVWKSLTHDNKVLIQHQLDEIFIRLRTLKNDGRRLGGVNGEGVMDDHMFPHRSKEVITTVAQFEDFQFSACPRASKAWVLYLRSFLPRPTEDTVFTHGDIWLANIMVKTDNDGNYVVSGIIDWENSGFYPESHESTRLLHGFTKTVETDWPEYLPACISPARYPVHWLVHRLWTHTVTNSG